MRLARVSHGLGLLLICSVWAAAKEDPVQWALQPVGGYSQVEAGSKVWLELTATVQPGYHLYSPTTPPGGPIATKIRLAEHPAIGDAKLYRPAPLTKRDPNFGVDTETYADKAVFYIEVQTKAGQAGPAELKATAYYQACSDVKCLLPVRKTAIATVTFGGGGGRPGEFKMPSGYGLVPGKVLAPDPANEAGVSSQPTAQTRSPATSRTDSRPATNNLSTQQDLLPFLLTAFLFGLAALFTPCVFPMIPITVSFFLNQGSADGESKTRGWKQAALFCIGIIVLFTGLGFLVTAITGPFGVVQLGSSPWVNGFISVIFFVFGLSLLGAFEIRLPSGLLTRLDRASQGSGYVGTLLMGLTFSLTSFACIGPIVGPLLVASVQSKGAQPVLGMASFATGLALPFFFLALFPAYLKRLPRSGGWLARVKVVLGFVVLAAMFKYLSNIDLVLQTHILTRERFLAIWIVLFAMAGLYLLGFLKLEGMTKEEPLGVARALVAAALLIFSISLIPGLFGARLGELDAYVPEPTGSLFANTAGPATEPANYFKNDLDGAIAAARGQSKLLLINFTGYACTNCHWMKANIFTRPEIQTALKDLVVVDLYTDGTDAESQKNAELEDKKFNTASIPFYAIIDTEQNVIATFPQLTRNPKEFLSFLGSRPPGKA